MSFSFNSQIERQPRKTKYSVQIETDSKEQFEFMEQMARECLDGKHKPVKVKVKESMYPRCYKCMRQLECTQTKDFEHKCPDYVKDAPDGGFYS